MSEDSVQSASLSYRTATRGPELKYSRELREKQWVWTDDTLRILDRAMNVYELLAETDSTTAYEFYLDGAPPQ